MRLIKNYILSIIALFLLAFCSFFNPSSIEGSITFEHLDKLVHFAMYLGVASSLWFDYLRTSNNQMKNGYVLALLFPVILGGIIELLQEYATVYRGGEWGDFIANSLGVLSALLVAKYVLKPFLAKYYFL